MYQDTMNESLNVDWGIYSDCHKDATGFRPRYSFPATVEQYEKDMKSFCRQIQIDNDNEARAESAAWLAWNRSMDSIMATCNCSLAQAITYDLQAHDMQSDIGYYCWTLRLGHFYVEQYIRHVLA